MTSKQIPVPQFGARQGDWDYPDRLSVYGLARDERDRLLVVSTRDKLVLPGGGVDGEESMHQALQREVLEETGWHAAVEGEFCRARQYVVSCSKGRSFNKDGRFFRIRLLRRAGPPLETGHQPVWLTAGEAARVLHHEFQRWAIGRLAAPDL